MSRWTAALEVTVQKWPLTRAFVGPVGLEPTTRGLKVRCSAIELEAPGDVGVGAAPTSSLSDPDSGLLR
jgi:hypothetical protein